MTDAELIESYASGPARLRQAVSGMTREQLLARPIAGRWSTQEVVIHLADADLAFAHRIKRIIAEDRPVYSAWDQDKFIARLAYNEQSADDALVTIEATHRQMARVFHSIGSGFLDRYGVHSERGEQTGRMVLEYADWHMTHHLKFVDEKRKALGLSVS